MKGRGQCAAFDGPCAGKEQREAQNCHGLPGFANDEKFLISDVLTG
jgi:hypothetical protein